MCVLVEDLYLGTRGRKRFHLWKGARHRGKKRRRTLLLAVALTPAFGVKATFRRSLKGQRSPIAASFHSRILGSVALASFPQPKIFNKDHATLMILILKYLIQIKLVSQQIQSGVLDNLILPWALEQGAASHDLKVPEEKFESLSIKEGSEVVTMAYGSGPEVQRAFQSIITFLKGPSGVQLKVHGLCCLECMIVEWLHDTVWTVS